MEGEQDKNKQANWDDQLIQVFCDLCIKNIEAGKRPSTHFSAEGWTAMIDEFAKLTGRFYTKVQLKNKWDALKVDWKIWKQLKGKETGLGWDPRNKTIDASNEWWSRKLEVIPKAKRFRKKGIPPEFEAMLDKMFMNTVATGEFAWTPSSGLLPQGSHTSSKNITLTMSGEDSSEDSEANMDSMIEKPTGSVQKKSKTSSCMKKGKKRKRVGGAEKLSEQIDRLCEAVESRSTATSKRDINFTPSIASVMEQLDTLPDIHTDFDLYLFATRLFMSGEKREMFVAIKKPEFKIAWLKNEQANL